jgi:hypothetical protein
MVVAEPSAVCWQAYMVMNDKDCRMQCAVMIGVSGLSGVMAVQGCMDGPLCRTVVMVNASSAQLWWP